MPSETSAALFDLGAPSGTRRKGCGPPRRRALLIIDMGPLMVLAVLGAVWGDTRLWRRRRRA